MPKIIYSSEEDNWDIIFAGVAEKLSNVPFSQDQQDELTKAFNDINEINLNGDIKAVIDFCYNYIEDEYDSNKEYLDNPKDHPFFAMKRLWKLIHGL